MVKKLLTALVLVSGSVTFAGGADLSILTCTEGGFQDFQFVSQIECTVQSSTGAQIFHDSVPYGLFSFGKGLRKKEDKARNAAFDAMAKLGYQEIGRTINRSMFGIDNDEYISKWVYIFKSSQSAALKDLTPSREYCVVWRMDDYTPKGKAADSRYFVSCTDGKFFDLSTYTYEKDHETLRKFMDGYTMVASWAEAKTKGSSPKDYQLVFVKNLAK